MKFVPKVNIVGLKIMVKSDLEKKRYFEIPLSADFFFFFTL